MNSIVFAGISDYYRDVYLMDIGVKKSHIKLSNDIITDFIKEKYPQALIKKRTHDLVTLRMILINLINENLYMFSKKRSNIALHVLKIDHSTFIFHLKKWQYVKQLNAKFGLYMEDILLYEQVSNEFNNYFINFKKQNNEQKI